MSNINISVTLPVLPLRHHTQNFSAQKFVFFGHSQLSLSFWWLTSFKMDFVVIGKVSCIVGSDAQKNCLAFSRQANLLLNLEYFRVQPNNTQLLQYSSAELKKIFQTKIIGAILVLIFSFRSNRICKYFYVFLSQDRQLMCCSYIFLKLPLSKI